MIGADDAVVDVDFGAGRRRTRGERSEDLVERAGDEANRPVGRLVADVEVAVMHFDLFRTDPYELAHGALLRCDAEPVPRILGQGLPRLAQRIDGSAEVGTQVGCSLEPSGRNPFGSLLESARIHR